MQSSGYSGGEDNTAIPIMEDNHRRCHAFKAARYLVKCTWQNSADFYFEPDTTKPGFDQWNDDAIVLNSLMGPKMESSALRNLDPFNSDGRNYISNFDFPLLKSEVARVFEAKGIQELSLDLKSYPSRVLIPMEDRALMCVHSPWMEAQISNSGAGTTKGIGGEQEGLEPYLAYILPTLTLSPQAKDVLRFWRELWCASLSVREAYSYEKRAPQLLAWDAGTYQLRSFWKDRFPREWETLQQATVRLEDHMRPGVYEYGFLRE